MGEKLQKKTLNGFLIRFFVNEEGPLYLDAPELTYAITPRELISQLQSGDESSQVQHLIRTSLSVYLAGKSKDAASTKLVRNHLFIPDVSTFDFTELKKIKVDVIKFKGNSDLEKTLQFINLALKFKMDLKFRLDFNESLKFADFLVWWKSLQPNIIGSIDFIEDPFTWDENHWKAAQDLNAPLALDFAYKASLFLKLVDPQKYAKVCIIKPYSELDVEILNGLTKANIRTVFGHGMESVVGRNLSFAMGTHFANEQEVHGLNVGDFYANDFDINNLESLDWVNVNGFV